MKIVIDGNIGCGKTTQLDLIEHRLKIKVKREPIEQWPLETFYQDPKRWGMTFQLVILNTFNQDNGTCIYERCPLSSKEIFWKVLEKTPLEDEVYNSAFERQGWGPDIFIFINKNPETCFKHIQKRTQEGDNGVTLEYLNKIHECYLDMYSSMTCKKYMVDGNQPAEDVYSDIREILSAYYDL
jgi:deoxyadenosine/deoxycytidine kinase